VLTVHRQSWPAQPSTPTRHAGRLNSQTRAIRAASTTTLSAGSKETRQVTSRNRGCATPPCHPAQHLPRLSGPLLSHASQWHHTSPVAPALPAAPARSAPRPFPLAPAPAPAPAPAKAVVAAAVGVRASTGGPPLSPLPTEVGVEGRPTGLRSPAVPFAPAMVLPAAPPLTLLPLPALGAALPAYPHPPHARTVSA